MTRVQELLLRLLRRGEGGAAPLPAGISHTAWGELLGVAPRGLHPYLAYRLPQLVEQTGLPREVLQSLESIRRSAAIRHIGQQGLLIRAAQALDSAGVPFVVLKGMALAHLAYPDPSLRPMGDLDLWTRPEYLDAGTSALLEAGLRFPSLRELRSPAAYRAELAPTRVLELPMAGGHLVLELHGVVQSMAVVASGWAEGAWNRCVTARLGGVEARVLHPEDMLAHLAVHCSEHHRFELGLGPLLDIALWTESAGAGLDWVGMADRWNRDGGATWIRLTLALARELLSARIPLEFADTAAGQEEFAPLYRMAREQVLEAHRALPLTLAKVSAEPSLAGRFRWLAYRLTVWYWKGPPGERRTALHVTREALRRIAHDIRHKLPPYLSGLADGSLLGAEYRRRRALAAGRGQLPRLVAEHERQKAGRREG
ncbi:MAG: nucleotidyltransferase family protein [Gemmatimonadota bacterium]|nr:nucleotidyltransferase family protein [Gemmatimonadota bacterium]